MIVLNVNIFDLCNDYRNNRFIVYKNLLKEFKKEIIKIKMKYVILAFNTDDTLTNGCIENNVKLTIEASNKEEAIEEFKSLVKRSNYQILEIIKE